MRTKPYTQIGIRRLKCFRCGKRAEFQWQICSDKSQYRPLCLDCDIELNKIILEFMGFPNKEELLSNYIKRLENE